MRSEYSRPNEYLSFIASTHDTQVLAFRRVPTLTIMTYMCIISCVQYIQYTTVYVVSTAIVALTVVVRVLVIHVVAATVNIHRRYAVGHICRCKLQPPSSWLCGCSRLSCRIVIAGVCGWSCQWHWVVVTVVVDVR